MRVTALSDLHGFYPKLPGGDLLIIAGDCTKCDSLRCWVKFFEWLDAQEYTKKVMVGGNHDSHLQRFANNDEAKNLYERLGVDFDITYDDTCVYLCDSETTFEGLRIWGSPWTRNFEGQNPLAMAFGLDTEKELQEKFSLIPEGIDILVTHSPPFGVLDAVESSKKPRCGSVALWEQMERIRPRYHFFGHIHECGGKTIEISGTRHCNVAHVDARYKPRSKVLTLF